MRHYQILIVALMELVNLSTGTRYVRDRGYEFAHRIQSRQFVASPALSPIINVLRHPRDRKRAGSRKVRRPISPNGISVGEFTAGCQFFSKAICLKDSKYPWKTIEKATNQNRRMLSVLFTEAIVDSRGLVDGVDPIQELAYTRQHYYGQNEDAKKHRNYSKQGGFVCPSDINYARPLKARNQNGKWKLIVNTEDVSQPIRLERCRKPGEACSFIGNDLLTQCSQIYSLERLVVYDEMVGLHIDVFKVPSGCSCHIKGYTRKFPPHQTNTSLVAAASDDRPRVHDGNDVTSEDHDEFSSPEHDSKQPVAPKDKPNAYGDRRRPNKTRFRQRPPSHRHRNHHSDGRIRKGKFRRPPNEHHNVRLAFYKRRPQRYRFGPYRDGPIRSTNRRRRPFRPNARPLRHFLDDSRESISNGGPMRKVPNRVGDEYRYSKPQEYNFSPPFSGFERPPSENSIETRRNDRTNPDRPPTRDQHIDESIASSSSSQLDLLLERGQRRPAVGTGPDPNNFNYDYHPIIEYMMNNEDR